MKKINKIKNLYKPTDINKLLRLGETSAEDLLKIGKAVGIDNIQVMWANDYDINSDKPSILNIGDSGIGSHWVAVYKGNYMDSFGLPPDSDIRGYKQLKYNKTQIQSISTGGCGSYSVLYLLYAINNDLDGFYAIFK